MDRKTAGRAIWALAPLALGVSLAHGQELPKLGKSPTKDVIAALTVEEKVNLVLGTGMQFPGLPPEMQGPVVGATASSSPALQARRLAFPASAFRPSSSPTAPPA